MEFEGRRMANTVDIEWEHSHDFGVDSSHQEGRVKIVFAITTVVMVLEIAAGTWSGSMALLADGWHMGTHSAAFAIALFTYFYAKKHANNSEFSFGTGKVNYLGSFASAVALLIVALMMAIESLQRLINPQAIHFNEAIVVAVIGLAVNFASVFLLHSDHHHDHDDDHHHDHNLKAAYFHVLADTLTSVLAIIALLAGKYFGLIWVDAIMGIVGALVISRWSYNLMRESSSVLLDKSDGSVSGIVALVQNENDVIVKDIHVWKISPSHFSAIVSVTGEKIVDVCKCKERITQKFPKISHISLEVC
jgi:cation diffusion facilitator family transporter